MDPLSILGIVAAIPGMFTSCLEVYGLISSAASHGLDFQVMLSRVDVEHARFILWGGTVGLIQSSTSSAGSAIDPRIMHPHILGPVGKILSCIQKSFEDAEKLKKRYGLVAGEGKLPSLPSDFMQLYGRSTPAFLSLSIFKGIYEQQQLAAAEMQKQNSVLKKARWAVVDKGRFSTAIDDLKTFNDSLHRLLPDVEWKTQERLRQEVLASQDENVLRLLQQASEGKHTGLKRAATTRLNRLNSRHQPPQMAVSAAHELPAINDRDSSNPGTWNVTTSFRWASDRDPHLEATKVEKPRSRSFPDDATLASPWDQDSYFNSSVQLPQSGSPMGTRRSASSLRKRGPKRELEILASSRATEGEAPDVPKSPDIVFLAGMYNLLDFPDHFSKEVTLPLNDTIFELGAETSNDVPPKSGVQHCDSTSPPVTPNLTEVFYICIDFQDSGTRAAIAHSSTPKDSDVVGGWPDNDTCDSYIQSAWVPSVLAYDRSDGGCQWGYQVRESQDQAGWFIAHLQGEKTGLMTYLQQHDKALQIALEEYFYHLLRHLLEAAEKKYGRDIYITSGIGCALIVSNKWENSVCTPLKDAVQSALLSLGINSDVTLQVHTSLAASYISAGLFTPHLEEKISTGGNSVEGNEKLFMVCHISTETQKSITIQTFQGQPTPSPEATNYHPPQFSSIGVQSVFREFKKLLERYYEYTGILSHKLYDSVRKNWLRAVQEFSGRQNSVWISCPYYPNCYECHCTGGELSITKGQMEGILNSFFAEVCMQLREGLDKVPRWMGRSKAFKGIYLCGELGSECRAMYEYLRRELPEQSIYQLPRSATEVATGATVAALKHGPSPAIKEISGHVGSG
ncbi:prion-inhibition and propagation-domain-containing protein [Tuber brumale]|nr:prion-inhibition and propagation-domain-containing protein [Tuber brumale]